MKRLTIVTVTKNNLSGLIETSNSLKSLKLEFEWIIKDGGSADGTLEYIDEFCQQAKYLGPPDLGIFDAMNTALNQIRTEYVLFLNAGDRVLNGFELESAIKVLENSEKSWLVAGALVSLSGKPIGYWETPTFPYLWRLIGLQSWCHQSTIYRTDFLIKNGSYDPESLIADWSTALVLEKIESPIVRVEPLSIFELGGISGSLSRSKWVRLHTKGRLESDLLFKNSLFLDTFFISYPSYFMMKKPILKRFLLPIFCLILKL
jgi:putative colanic acid biosynthesis glycosyltransferase